MGLMWKYEYCNSYGNVIKIHWQMTTQQMHECDLHSLAVTDLNCVRMNLVAKQICNAYNTAIQIHWYMHIKYMQ